MEIEIIKEVKNPVISIIVPTLNEEKYIGRCLFSLKDQDFNLPYEIIIGDSYSKDRTLEIAREYVNKIVLTKKRGAGAGRNAGAKYASGDFIIFIDADTIASRNLLREFYFELSKKDVVATTCQIIPESGKYLIQHALANFLSNTLGKVGKAILPGICFGIKKEIFWKVGGFNEEIFPGEDIDFSLRLIKRKIGKSTFLETTSVIASSRRINYLGLYSTVLKWWGGYIRQKIGMKAWNYNPIR